MIILLIPDRIIRRTVTEIVNFVSNVYGIPELKYQIRDETSVMNIVILWRPWMYIHVYVSKLRHHWIRYGIPLFDAIPLSAFMLATVTWTHRNKPQ